ncbi:MAG: elongation factor G [Spirochaetota bacterium]|nr:elongation factor G [Spirochaetota bacterium]
MKDYGIDSIRNVAVIGHTGVGKTTLIEHALYQTNQTAALGSVEAGTSVCDFDEEAMRRKISVQLALAACEIKGSKINFIDTPGSPDFMGDTRAAMRVSDGALVLLDAAAGIEIGTEALWHHADAYQLPRLVCVNKMDKDHADFFAVLESLRARFHKPCVAVQIPIGQGLEFKGIIDLVAMQAVYADGTGKGVRREAIPEDMLSDAEKYRAMLVDAAAESDDALIEKVLDGQTLTNEEITGGIRSGVLGYKFIPVSCCSLEAKLGIQLLLQDITASLPSPACRKEYAGNDPDSNASSTRRVDPAEAFAGFVFKTYTDQYAGRICLARIISGALTKDAEILNPRTGSKHRVSHMYSLEGKKQIEIEEGRTGDIIALTKIEGVLSGDTFCDKDKRFALPPMALPSAIYFLAIHAKQKKDEEKLNSLLYKSAEDDLTFHVRYNGETRETVIEAMGAQQVDVILSRIASRTKIEVETTVPKVAYRETITKGAPGHHKHKKQSGGHGQYGEVYIEVAPIDASESFVFEDAIVGGAIPRNYIPGVEKGLREGMDAGVLAAYPMTGVHVKLYDGTFHDVDSSEMSFKIAGRMALRDAVSKAGPVLLEPIMDLTVYVDEEAYGSVISDLNSRRGRLLASDGEEESKGTGKKVRAKVPLAELLKYAVDLKSLTSGKATFEMSFSHYDPLSGRAAETVIASRKAELEALDKE